MTEHRLGYTHQRLWDVDGCASGFIVPSDSTAPAQDHGEGSDEERQHIALSTMAEPIYRRFRVRPAIMEGMISGLMEDRARTYLSRRRT